MDHFRDRALSRRMACFRWRASADGRRLCDREEWTAARAVRAVVENRIGRGIEPEGNAGQGSTCALWICLAGCRGMRDCQCVGRLVGRADLQCLHAVVSANRDCRKFNCALSPLVFPIECGRTRKGDILPAPFRPSTGHGTTGFNPPNCRPQLSYCVGQPNANDKPIRSRDWRFTAGRKQIFLLSAEINFSAVDRCAVSHQRGRRNFCNAFALLASPRFSLRALFVLIALVSIPMGRVAYQLNWIRQRRDFAYRHRPWRESSISMLEEPPDAPWSLRLFRETSYRLDEIPTPELDRAKELFPEIFTD
jgi:hypothetical protein